MIWACLASHRNCAPFRHELTMSFSAYEIFLESNVSSSIQQLKLVKAKWVMKIKQNLQQDTMCSNVPWNHCTEMNVRQFQSTDAMLERRIGRDGQNAP